MLERRLWLAKRRLRLTFVAVRRRRLWLAMLGQAQPQGGLCLVLVEGVCVVVG